MDQDCMQFINRMILLLHILIFILYYFFIFLRGKREARLERETKTLMKSKIRINKDIQKNHYTGSVI